MVKLIVSDDVSYRFVWIEGKALSVAVIVDRKIAAIHTQAFT